MTTKKIDQMLAASREAQRQADIASDNLLAALDSPQEAELVRLDDLAADRATEARNALQAAILVHQLTG